MYCLECALYAKIALSKADPEDMRVAYEKRREKTNRLMGLYWPEGSCDRCGKMKFMATRKLVGL